MAASILPDTQINRREQPERCPLTHRLSPLPCEPAKHSTRASQLPPPSDQPEASTLHNLQECWHGRCHCNSWQQLKTILHFLSLSPVNKQSSQETQKRLSAPELVTFLDVCHKTKDYKAKYYSESIILPM